MKIIKYIAALCCIALLLAGCAPAEGPTAAGDGSEAADTVENDANDAAGSQVVDPNSAEGAMAGIIEPAQLISKQEAEQLTGVALKDGEVTEQAVVGLKVCFYDAADENSDIFLQVSLTQAAAFPEGSTQTPEDIFVVTKGAFGDSLIEVEGIGDEAFIATPGLHILSHGYYIVVCAGNTDNEEIQSIIKSGGELAVRNLGAIIG